MVPLKPSKMPVSAGRKYGNTLAYLNRRNQRYHCPVAQDGARILRLHLRSLFQPTHPRYTVLWRSVYNIKEDRLKGIHGKLNTGVMISQSPTDFASRRCIFSFTPDREIAYRYCQWMKQKAHIAAVSLVRVSVPNALIASMNPHTLTYRLAWKEIIYSCRREELLPAHLKYIQSERLIIGPIAGSHNKGLSSLTSADEIDEENVLRLQDGRCAVQYVFYEDEEETLNRYCHDLVQVENFSV